MKTLYDKLWEEHHVTQLDSGESLLYIDRHYLHEVTSPQAFEGLIKKNLKPWRLNANIATPDHNVPTTRGNNFNSESITDEISKIQVVELDKNCNKFGIKQFDIEVTGRHDPCVGIRAVPIAEAMVSLVLVDHLLINKAQCADVEQNLPFSE